MRVLLDAQGLTSLAGDRARLRVLRERSGAVPVVPSTVLTESLTGDHRRDFHENRLLRSSRVVEVDESLAREAAALRTAAARPRVSATDAIVVAAAARLGVTTILTSDPGDLQALASVSTADISVVAT